MVDICSHCAETNIDKKKICIAFGCPYDSDGQRHQDKQKVQTQDEYGPVHKVDENGNKVGHLSSSMILGPKMTTSEEVAKSLTMLGSAQTNYPQRPEDAVLETFINPHQDIDYYVRFSAPEFTSLCPKTGQPDFAHLVIDYVPNVNMIESKALKLFLFSFRNHGAFHEDCTVTIAKRLFEVMVCKYLRIGGYWYPRGGIPIDIFVELGDKPPKLWIPPQNIAGYRGRG